MTTEQCLRADLISPQKGLTRMIPVIRLPDERLYNVRCSLGSDFGGIGCRLLGRGSDPTARGPGGFCGRVGGQPH